MRVLPVRVEAVLRKPDAAILLLHGDDAGLVRTRAKKALMAATQGQPSPFQSSTLLKEEHARLRDEAQSVPLDGSRRIIRVQDAGDGLVAALNRLADEGCPALIILEAGLLLPRSKLRAAAEAGTRWASIACVVEGVGGVTASIREALGAAGLRFDEDAVHYLSATLAGDTSRRQAELQKLVLYAGQDGAVTLDMAMACCAAEEEFAAATAFTAAMLGRVAEADDQLAAAAWEGATGPGLLAGFGGHLHRLLRIRLLMDSGLSGEVAGRQQRPPLYPRQLESVLRQVASWQAADLVTLLAAVSTADAACKRAATRDVTIASKVILDAARHAGHRRPSRPLA